MSRIRIEMGDEKFELLCDQIDKILNADYSDEMRNRLLARLLGRYGIGMAYNVTKVSS